MSDNYEKEIDIKDLLFFWITKWRSLVIFLIIGVIMAALYMYNAKPSLVLSGGEEDGVVTSIAESSTLSSLSSEKMASVSVEDMETLFLSEKDVETVDELIGLYEEYLENVEEYNKQKDSLELTDRAEAFSYIVTVKNVIEIRIASLTADQQIYYYAKLGMDLNADSINDGGNAEPDDLETFSVVGGSKKKAVFIILLAIFVHFLIMACCYIGDKKIKYSDSLSSMVNIPEYTRIIDWEKVDSKKGLDKQINKFRIGSLRRTEVSDVLDINAAATLVKLKKKKYSSVALVGPGLDEERNAFSKHILKASEDIVVKSIDSITHSVNGSDSIEDVESAILIVRVGYTRYVDFFEEIKSLKERYVDVIGIAVFE